jgi:predicted aminopeptidase
MRGTTPQAHRRFEALRRRFGGQAFDTLVRQEKATVLAELRQQYAQVREGWGGSPELYRDLDQWVTQANNAALAALAAKERLAPAFERMFVLADGDWPRFIDSIGRLRSLSQSSARWVLM